ncbi:MAG: protein phosphatase 2C domain-containing protein [Clostridia bacterium]|nr:protein phosphatase 2C domain-containing protein [Clostridia bacterium]
MAAYDYSAWFCSRTGERHLQEKKDNQDVAFVKSDGNITFAAVADGVSSCKNGAQGARVACEKLYEAMTKESRYLFGLKEESVAYLIVSYLQSEIGALADREGEDAMSYASTLSFLCIDEARNLALSFSVGDSFMSAVMKDRRVKAIGHPPEPSPDLICTTMTTRAYEDSAVTFLDMNDVASVLICSDGAWRAMLQKKETNQQVMDYVVKNDTEGLDRFFGSAGSRDDCTCMLIRQKG